MIKYLSEIDRNVIDKFLKDDKPLFIYGSSGVGKTTLGKDILKDYQATTFDAYDMKKYKNMKDHILDISMKKNITLMFDNNKERGILLDDIDIFHKSDKKSMNGIISFLKDKKYYRCKIIVIFHEKILKNKPLMKIDHYKLHLNHANNVVRDILRDISRDKNIRFTDEKINKSRKNLNILINNDTNEIKNDIQYKSDEIMNHLVKGDRSINDILAMNLGDENVFLLNILENLYQLVDKEKLSYIYNLFVIYDNIELYSTKNHIWEMKEYSKQMILRSIYISSRKKIEELKFNSYISKSILSISSNKKENATSYISVYVYLHMIHHHKDQRYYKYLDHLSKKGIEKMEKRYFYFMGNLGPTN
jgi:hypothetical protein